MEKYGKQEVRFPEMLHVIREVTDEEEYKNNSLAETK